MSGLIHHDSAPCAKSELDLFLIPPTQTAIEKGHFVEYHPLSNIQDGGPVEFNISGNGEEYYDLPASHLHVKVKVLKADGSSVDATDMVAPVNLLLQALFSQVDVSLNERAISSSSNTYPYRAYIETLLNYGDDAKQSLLTCEGFFKDANLNDADSLKGLNPGLVKRHSQITGGKIIDLIGPLHCDIFQQNRLLLNMVDLKIKMIRSKPEFCLMAPIPETGKPKAAYKIVLEHASLFMRKVRVNPGVLIGHAKALEKSTAKYPVDRVLCKTYSISTGSRSFMQDNVYLGAMPKRVTIGLLPNAALNGEYHLNPFFFDHYNTTFAGVFVDGQSVPSKPLELDFENGNYVRAYHRLFHGFNQDSGIDISRDEFAAGHTLFTFDLTADMCGEAQHLNLQQQGNLRIELKFAQPLSETLSVFVYAEFENIIEISKQRHVLCDFPN